VLVPGKEWLRQWTDSQGWIDLAAASSAVDSPLAQAQGWEVQLPEQEPSFHTLLTSEENGVVSRGMLRILLTTLSAAYVSYMAANLTTLRQVQSAKSAAP